MLAAMQCVRLGSNPRLSLCLSALMLATGCSSAEPASTPKAHSTLGPDQFESTLGTISITPLNHGTLWINVGKLILLIDPTSAALGYSGRRADIILVTDIHHDHLERDAIAQATGANTYFVWPKAVDEKLAADRPKHGQIKVLSNGESVDILGIKVTAVPMYNLTRGPKPGQLYHERGRGNGYLLDIGNRRFYISGDSACTPEMKALREVDVALVCMNLPYTMPPNEAAECVAAFKPGVVYPYHYRGSDLGQFQTALKGHPNIDVRLRDWYKGEG